MIVLDASVLIALLDAQDAHHRAARQILTAHVEEQYAASVLTVAEVLVHPTRAGVADRAAGALRALELSVVSLAEDDTFGLARIRAEYALRMPDAVVLHTAVATRAELATFDAALRSAAEQAGVAVRSPT